MLHCVKRTLEGRTVCTLHCTYATSTMDPVALCVSIADLIIVSCMLLHAVRDGNKKIRQACQMYVSCSSDVQARLPHAALQHHFTVQSSCMKSAGKVLVDSSLASAFCWRLSCCHIRGRCATALGLSASQPLAHKQRCMALDNAASHACRFSQQAGHMRRRSSSRV